ncbi:MAG TPA: DUF4142 domain-containing protein [Gemmatimonadales bacterium]|nr:DUF4142 domain-containing protein [Gemmatimonadales bacterium]
MSRSLLPALGLAALIAVVPASASAQQSSGKSSLDDPTIVAIFDATNTADVETSGLAMTKAQHDDVRALAKQFVNDHKAVRQQGRDLAKKLGVTPTPPKDSSSAVAHRKVMQQLKSASADQFDCTYLNHEVAFHDAVLKAVSNTLLPAIQNAELKAFVEKVGPAFKGHLEAARSLQKKYSCGK